MDEVQGLTVYFVATPVGRETSESCLFTYLFTGDGSDERCSRVGCVESGTAENSSVLPKNDVVGGA